MGKTDAHQDIIEEHRLLESSLNRIHLVRVEITPPDMNLLLPFDQWEFKVDQDKLPEWYDKAEVERRVRAELPAWYDKHVITSDAVLDDGEYYVFGSSTVKAPGKNNTIIHAYQRSVVFDARDSVTLFLRDHATAVTYGLVHSHVSDFAEVVAYGQGIVYAQGDSKVALIDRSVATLRERASGKFYDRTYGNVQGHTFFEAHDEARIVVFWAEGVKGSCDDHACVEIFEGDVEVDAAGQSTVSTSFIASEPENPKGKVIVNLAKNSPAVYIDRRGGRKHLVCAVSEDEE